MEFGFSVPAAFNPAKKKLPDLTDVGTKITSKKIGGKKENTDADTGEAQFIDLSRKTLRLLDRSQQEKAIRVIDKMGAFSAKVVNIWS